jgi:hypothetical protein
MMKDEQDIAYHTLIHLAEEGVDGIIVADNLSVDGTRDEIERARKDTSCPIEVIEDKDPAYYQSEKMTKLAHNAHEKYGADWIIPFDADELWYSHTDRIAVVLRNLPGHVGKIEAELWNHFPSSIDPEGTNPFETIEWRQKEPGALPKVAVRYHPDLVIYQGNHSALGPPQTISYGTHLGVSLQLRHFPYRTFEQFKRKAINGAKAYAATDLHETTGAHWRSYGNILEQWGEDVLRTEVFEKYFYFFSPVDGGMIYDPAPFRRWSS